MAIIRRLDSQGFRHSNAYLVSVLVVGSLILGPTGALLLPTITTHARFRFVKPLFAASLLIEEDDTMTNAGSRYIRWKTPASTAAPSNVWELQTAVTTFQRNNPETNKPERIELHAQVHFGEQEYFDFYNRPEFTQKQNEVLFELLVDDSLLGLSDDKSGRVLKSKLQASPNDEALANDYGWQCQVNVMDYTQPRWKQADFTRQELLQQQQRVDGDTNLRPLWLQVSTGGTAFWQPAVSALLVGPPSLFVASDKETPTKRKLFTNLFLPGNQLTGWLRATLWMTVPAPEISVLLLDWSSLFLSENSAAKFSPVTLPILQSLMTLKLTQLRQLVFGQVLVSGNSAASQRQQRNDDWNLLVTQRNHHALRVLKSSLRASTKSASTRQLALLYGCSHCPDLHSKLVRHFGFKPIKTEWRTAWSVPVPNTFAGEKAMNPTQKSNEGPSLWTDLLNPLPPTAWAALVVFFPLYLGIGAVDWIDTIHSSSVSLFDDGDAAAFAGDWTLYLFRRVLLYVGVSKFALEWQDPRSNRSRG